MCHVSHQISADIVTNLPHSGVVQDPRVGAGSSDDDTGMEIPGLGHQSLVVNQACTGLGTGRKSESDSHTVIQSNSHTVRFLYFHTVKFPYFHTLKFPYFHTVQFSYFHTAIHCQIPILPCSSVMLHTYSTVHTNSRQCGTGEIQSRQK